VCSGDGFAGRVVRRAGLLVAAAAGALALLEVLVDVEVAVHALDVVAHVVLAREAAGVTLAGLDGAEEGVGGVEAVGFLFVAGEDGFAAELRVVALSVAADVGLECGFKMFALGGLVAVKRELEAGAGEEYLPKHTFAFGDEIARV
jgi:hypothetical protein